MRIEEFLREQKVPFDVLHHRTTYTAQDTAHSLHVPGDNLAKTVVLNVDGEHVLAVLPATHAIDFDSLRQALSARSVELAPEDELSTLFDDCELGAVPPFGSQYGLPTLVDKPLCEDEHIVFDGNTHGEAIYMRYHDFEKIEHPRVAAFSHHL
ncbi:MAG: YbaK/EbsC family protein [Planctomycetes bacterium]|nr:YbaK/EbsC family protein [Planctomycetota bacterium]